MPNTFPCPSCSRKLKIEEKHLGRTLLCPKCNAGITISLSSAATPHDAQELVPVETISIKEEEDSCSSEPSEQNSATDIVVQTGEVVAEDDKTADVSSGKNAGATVHDNADMQTTVLPETPDTDFLSELKPLITEIREKLDSLTSSVDFGTKFAEKKQEQIDKLYDENQKYKQGIFDKFKKSLILAVIEQIDAANKTIFHFGNQEFSEENYSKLLKNYNEIASDFQDSLVQSFDIVAFSSNENTPFDAKRQRALKTVATEDETKHKTISKSIRPGYEIVNADETITLLRLEMVEVYVHQTPQS